MIEAYIADREQVVVAPQALKDRAKPILRTFRDKLPRHIRKEHCRSYVAARRNSGISDATIRTELGFLSTALNYAKREGWIDDKPYIEMPPAPPPRERWLTEGEAKRLLRAAHPFHLRLFIMIALNTGSRSGAVLDLTWDRVDLETRRIDFNVPGRPRTKKRRTTAPINGTLHVELKTALERATCEFVIEWGGRQVSSIKKSFREAAGRAKLEDVTPHTLRHTAATWMVQKGIPMWEIAGLLGHSDPGTTARVYAKHSPEYLEDAVAAIDKCVGGFRPKFRVRRRKRRKAA